MKFRGLVASLSSDVTMDRDITSTIPLDFDEITTDTDSSLILPTTIGTGLNTDFTTYQIPEGVTRCIMECQLNFDASNYTTSGNRSILGLTIAQLNTAGVQPSGRPVVFHEVDVNLTNDYLNWRSSVMHVIPNKALIVTPFIGFFNSGSSITFKGNNQSWLSLQWLQ